MIKLIPENITVSQRLYLISEAKEKKSFFMCLTSSGKRGGGFTGKREETKVARVGHLDGDQTVDAVVSDAALAEHTHHLLLLPPEVSDKSGF